MSNFACGNIYTAMRLAPSHKSEMVSQILFGEMFTVTDELPGWVKIRTEPDGYSGWTCKKHLISHEVSGGTKGFVLNESVCCICEDGTGMVIGPGSEICEPDFDAKTFRTGERIFRVSGEFKESFLKPEVQIYESAMRFINVPYLWGGRSVHGIDCSGLVQLACKIHGVSIPRDAGQQAEAGDLIGFIGDAMPGDLAFFDDERGRISHVGMIIPGNRIIHASGRVRVDTVDHQGIFMPGRSIYTHKLRLIKRVHG